MLIQFAVENYSSFKDRQVFSMVAGKHTRHPEHCVTANGTRLLRGSFFFGANASGKSNFVRAIDFVRHMVLVGTRAIKYRDQHFRIDSDCREKPGVFQTDFFTNDTIYSYGFAFHYQTQEFLAEWLYRIDSPNKELCIFEREKGKKIKTDLSFQNESSNMRFEIYGEDVKEDELFLTLIGDKDLGENPDFRDFLNAYNWFKKIEVVYPDSHAQNPNDVFVNSFDNPNTLINMLRFFDTGIQAIIKGRQPLEKAFPFLPDEIRKELLDNIARNIREKSNNSTSAQVEINNQHRLDISMENGEIIAEKMLFDHGNKLDLFELDDESDGTKRLFDLLPVYDLGKKEKIIVVDELDRSLHSKLTEKYVELFFEVTKDKYSQLICTTHDINLMNLKLLRQDEIWFVEREEDHASRIYSLSDYKQKLDENVLNDYLLGRYGAIPCFNSIELQEDAE